MPDRLLAQRLRRLPATEVLGREARVAVGLRARLLGLAFLDREAAGGGLLIPRCSSVHTFGMRFPLEVVFLDARNEPMARHRNLSPRRFVSYRGASSVLEFPHIAGGRPGHGR